jgi:NIMA-interacting peptidyl-prolyl cis-trans isomerase 1
MSVSESLRQVPPPDALPVGWILRHSRSQPGNVYFYNQETGESVWQEPAATTTATIVETSVPPVMPEATTATTKTTNTETMKQEETKKRPPVEKETSTTSTKRPKQAQQAQQAPKEVRVLHILKKHKDSRRPSSWRTKKITCTKQQAIDELQELLSILKESSSEEELRATMEELARTESDCSSAKRGGDLGYFGPKKMQPAFEQASFALEKGELSEIVETSSGVHILLRIG